MDAEEIRAASRRRRAERKLAQQIAAAGGAWTRCLYKVPGKERYCAQHRSKLSTMYCGTHMGETEEKGRRVPCPVDPNHTVFEHQLAAHTKICNLAILQARLEAQPYYSKGINSGPPLSEGEGEKAEEIGDASDGAFDEAFLLDLISRVAVAHRDLVGEIPTEVLDGIPEVQPLHRTRTEDGKGFRKGRHILQHASLVGHLVKRGLAGPVDDGVDGTANSNNGAVGHRPRVLHVEMGAGKGALGQSIAAAFPGAEVTMVERSSVRRKAENRLDGVSARARIDIRDLNMAGLPSLAPRGEQAHSNGGGGSGDSGKPVVAVAKHLCGVATDLALRAMLTLSPAEPPRASRSSGVDAGGGGGGGRSGGETTAAISMPSAAASRVGGVAVATCCHHVCSWRDYAGREFLTREGFSARDFEAMRRMSAWISLEPEAGTRKNNKYPDEKHPAAVAAVGSTSASPSPLPPSGQNKGLAATAAAAATAPQPTITEDDEFSEVTESSGEVGAIGPPAATSHDAGAGAASAAAFAGAGAGDGAAGAAADGDAAEAAGTPASTIPETSQEKTAGRLKGGPHVRVHRRTEAAAREPDAGGGRRRGPGRSDGGDGGDGGTPSNRAATSPPPLPPSLTPPLTRPPPPRSPVDDEPHAGLPLTPTPAPAVTRRRYDRSAAKDAEDGGEDHHRQRDRAPPPPAAATAAPTSAPAAGVVPAVVAARVPKPLLALGALTPAEKARAARECKRLMDRGRRAFIEERLGLASEVVHFVGTEVTPENALLLGFRK